MCLHISCRRVVRDLRDFNDLKVTGINEGAAPNTGTAPLNRNVGYVIILM